MTDALLVTSSFLPGRGGIESYLAELCAELAPRLAVFAQAERDGLPLPTDLAYRTIGYDGSLIVPTRRVARAIETAAREHHTDKIVFGTPWPLALLGPRLAGRGFRYAVIVHGAELLVPAAIPGVRQRLAAALKRADLLLPVSDFTKSKLEQLLGDAAPPLHTMRARVDLDRFSPAVQTRGIRERLGLRPTDRIVLCFGRLVKRKGVDRAIAALARLYGSHPDAVLVVAGTGPEESSLRKRAQRGDGRVIFAGRVEDEDAPALYSAADVFVLAVVDRLHGLETEGLGVVLLEAAATATPSVTGRSGGTPEAVLDGVTGFVTDASDVEALAGKIAALLDDPVMGEDMGISARLHVRRAFSEDRIPSDFLAWLGRSI